MLLHPHHALCIHFFEGKGYSEGFVSNMYGVIKRLSDLNPQLTLTSGANPVCSACPKNRGGRCEDREVVEELDMAVLSALSLDFGDEIRWSELSNRAESEIIERGRIAEICKNCCWLYICNR